MSRIYFGRDKERRRDIRLTSPVLSVHSDDARYVTVNWSLGGFCARPVAWDISPGTRLSVELQSTDARLKFQLQIEVAVIWVSEMRWGGHFVGLTDKQFTMLQRLQLIHEQTAARPSGRR